MFLSGLNRPEGLVVDVQGTLYVADTENGRIVTLERGGSPVSWKVEEATGFIRPTDVAVDTIYPKARGFVGDWINDQVLVFERR